MVRYQAADKEAASEFVYLVSPMLYRFFCHHTGNREDASDLLQESWLRIHKSRDTYRPGEPVLPWLFGIARHVRIDGYRRMQRVRSRERTVEDILEVAVAIPELSRTRGFEALINPLPPRQREVVTMLKLSGLTLEEVASVTGCSVGAVKQKAHRAYETLRKLLGSPQDLYRSASS